MPYKLNADSRAKIPKQKRPVTNWIEYNEVLWRHGDLKVWVAEDARALWWTPRRKTLGGQPLYSELAIELCLRLRQVVI